MDRSANVRSELLEREGELDRLDAAVRAAGRRAGEAVVVEAAAGMGKSRLLDEARVRRRPARTPRPRCPRTELEQAFPFGVMRQLFERLLVDADEQERDRWLAGAAGLAAEVLTGALPAPPGPVQGPSAGDPGYAWQHGLYWLASNLSADAPLVLVVDDLQWCDTPSLRALLFIARRLDGQPLGAIMATRPPDPGLTSDTAALLADPAVETLRPAPLSSNSRLQDLT